MGLRQYTCNFHKSLMLGNKRDGMAQFADGYFETEDPRIQHMIESNNAFGTSIHFKDSVEEMERIGRQRQEKVAGEAAALRKKIMDEQAAEEKEQQKQKSAKAKAEAEAERKAVDEKRLVAAKAKAEGRAD